MIPVFSKKKLNKITVDSEIPKHESPRMIESASSMKNILNNVITQCLIGGASVIYINTDYSPSVVDTKTRILASNLRYQYFFVNSDDKEKPVFDHHMLVAPCYRKCFYHFSFPHCVENKYLLDYIKSQYYAIVEEKDAHQPCYATDDITVYLIVDGLHMFMKAFEDPKDQEYPRTTFEQIVNARYDHLNFRIITGLYG